MRIPVNWLKEYVNIKESTKEIAKKLIMSGTEVEKIDSGGNFEGNTVGEVLEVDDHPNADKLSVTKTKVGGNDIRTIVCGAPNVQAGQKVPVALPGAYLGEFAIKKTKIRGVESNGMICSEAELGISDDHSGIMVLDPRAKVGENIAKALNIGGEVLEAEITPNRGDCLSILGIARETAAVFDSEVSFPKVKFEEGKKKASDVLSISIEDDDLCPRYIGRVIEGVKIGESPKWLKERISAVGIRPINNIVDATNFVMYEMGQPLHAFDLDKIKTKEIVVRKAKGREKITTLDGEERVLKNTYLAITDGKKPIAIAGVMGSENTEVDENTKNIVIESANFDPTSVRKTAQRLGIRTEASNRFEKGIPLKTAEEACERATQLILQIAGGEALAGKIDEGKNKDKERKVTFDTKRIKGFLGEEIPKNRVLSILKKLGFEVDKKDGDRITLIIPYWRLDVSIEEDILEEIARIYGYDNVGVTLPAGEMPAYRKNETVEMAASIRDIFSGLGFWEVYSYSFVSQKLANISQKDSDLIKVANPLSAEQEYLRADMLGSHIQIAVNNLDNLGENMAKIYEIAPVYLKGKKEEIKISGLLFGKVSAFNIETLFSEAKGALEAFFEAFNISSDDIEFVSREDTSKAEMRLKGKEAGFVKVIAPSEFREYGGKRLSGVFFEIDLNKLKKVGENFEFRSLPKFPKVKRDLTFVLDESIGAEEILRRAREKAPEILEKAEVVDVYKGKEISGGKKSITITFYYQSYKRTLTDKEVDDDQSRIEKKIKQDLGGQLKSGENKKR